jgi:hypothetical protein
MAVAFSGTKTAAWGLYEYSKTSAMKQLKFELAGRVRRIFGHGEILQH